MNQHGQSMFEIGGASMCILILDTDVAVTDILQDESRRVSGTETDVEIFTDVYECGTVT